MAKHPKRLSALLLSSYLVLVQDLSWSDAPRQSQERVFDLFLRTTYRRSQTAPLAFDFFVRTPNPLPGGYRAHEASPTLCWIAVLNPSSAKFG